MIIRNRVCLTFKTEKDSKRYLCALEGDNRSPRNPSSCNLVTFEGGLHMNSPNLTIAFRARGVINQL